MEENNKDTNKPEKALWETWWAIMLFVLGFLILAIIFFPLGANDTKEENPTAQPTQDRTIQDEQIEETSETNEITPVEEPAEIAPKQWIEVKSFTGSGDLTTENFYISSSNWRITASGSSDSPDMASISTYIYENGKNPNTDGSDAVFSIRGNGPETCYIRLGTGTFFLNIGSANTNWTVKVEEER